MSTEAVRTIIFGMIAIACILGGCSILVALIVTKAKAPRE